MKLSCLLMQLEYVKYCFFAPECIERNMTFAEYLCICTCSVHIILKFKGVIDWVIAE